MSTKRASPLATAFLWAVGMTATYGLMDAFILHENAHTLASDLGTAAGVAFVVGYNERKEALKPQ